MGNAFPIGSLDQNIPVYKLATLVCKRIRGEIIKDDIEKELRILRIIHK